MTTDSRLSLSIMQEAVETKEGGTEKLGFVPVAARWIVEYSNGNYSDSTFRISG